MDAYTCSTHTRGSMFGRARSNPPEFLRSLLASHALANRAVCQPPQVAPTNKWSWVRADNTGHVDLVNLARGILQSPYDTRDAPNDAARICGVSVRARQRAGLSTGPIVTSPRISRKRQISSR